MPQKRAFIFSDDQITCRNCQYNYPMPNTPKDQDYGTYCQEFTMPVPSTEEECLLLGHDCLQWFPAKFSRATAKGEHNDKRKPRWYEKDNVV